MTAMAGEGHHPEMTAERYHADPCAGPSLSSSIAILLLSQSPLHAWAAHPRLNPDYRREESEAFDLGTAAHAYVLQGSSAFEIIEAPDWRTKAAKEARDQARLVGKVPMLAHRWADVKEMGFRATAALLNCEQPTPLTTATGAAEQTLVWREGDVLCRARLDWLHDDHRTVDDYKTTGGSANPDEWTRSLFGMGYDVQAAFYLRGVRAVFGTEATFRFVVQENYAPYALSVIALGPAALVLAEKKVIFALGKWRECMATGKWSGYPTRTCYADLPGWEETRWLEKETRSDDGRPIGDLL